MDLSGIGQIGIAGLTQGAIYALVAVGLSLVFSVRGFLNLLQGEFVILAGLVTIAFSEWLGMPLPAAIAIAVVICALVGVFFERSALSPDRRLSPETAMMVTVGGAFAIRGAAMVLFGRDPLSLASFSGERPIVVKHLAIATQSFWIFGALVLTSLTLWWFFEKTFLGKALQACAQNLTGAQLSGIDPRRMSTITFLASAVLGAIAGVVATPLNFASYDEGLGISIKGFIAAALGGVGSFPGAVAGGLLLGLAESLSAAFISSEFKDVVSFVLLLVLLLFRPNGLFRRA